MREDIYVNTLATIIPDKHCKVLIECCSEPNTSCNCTRFAAARMERLCKGIALSYLLVLLLVTARAEDQCYGQVVRLQASGQDSTEQIFFGTLAGFGSNLTDKFKTAPFVVADPLLACSGLDESVRGERKKRNTGSSSVCWCSCSN